MEPLVAACKVQTQHPFECLFLNGIMHLMKIVVPITSRNALVKLLKQNSPQNCYAIFDCLYSSRFNSSMLEYIVANWHRLAWVPLWQKQACDKVNVSFIISDEANEHVDEDSDDVDAAYMNGGLDMANGVGVKASEFLKSESDLLFWLVDSFAPLCSLVQNPGSSVLIGRIFCICTPIQPIPATVFQELLFLCFTLIYYPLSADWSNHTTAQRWLVESYDCVALIGWIRLLLSADWIQFVGGARQHVVS